MIPQIKKDKIVNTGPRQLPASTDPRHPAPDNDCGVLFCRLGVGGVPRESGVARDGRSRSARR